MSTLSTEQKLEILRLAVAANDRHSYSIALDSTAPDSTKPDSTESKIAKTYQLFYSLVADETEKNLDQAESKNLPLETPKGVIDEINEFLPVDVKVEITKYGELCISATSENGCTRTLDLALRVVGETSTGL